MVQLRPRSSGLRRTSFDAFDGPATRDASRAKSPRVSLRRRPRALDAGSGATGVSLAQTWTAGALQERRPASGRRAGHAAGRAPGLMGLQNLGNTCFLNSTLQCLLHVPAVAALFAGEAFRAELDPESPMRGRVARSFAALAREMWHGRHAAVSPGALKRLVARYAPHFAGFQQQDSQEFLAFLMDGLATDLKRPAPAQRPPVLDPPTSESSWAQHLVMNDSAITDLFSGQLQSLVECQRCGGQSRCFDPFGDLSLPIPARPRSRGSLRRKFAFSARSKRAAAAAAAAAEADCQLADCLSAFCEEEVLEGVNCAHCGSPQRAVKRLSVRRFPPVLVLHLKRFEYSLTRRRKIGAHVDCPLELDVSAHASEPGASAQYDLVAVSNHLGNLAGGHYTATCRNSRDSDWYTFNDSTVSPLVGPPVTDAAYVLFYERRGAPSSRL